MSKIIYLCVKLIDFDKFFFLLAGKLLQESVRKEVSKIKNIKFRRVGFILSKDYPVLGASTDGIAEDCILEIKCPLSNKNIDKYVKEGVVVQKYNAQIQLQMFFARKEKCFFCIAHEDFESSKKVDIHEVTYDKDYCVELIKKCVMFWKENIFTQLL